MNFEIVQKIYDFVFQGRFLYSDVRYFLTEDYLFVEYVAKSISFYIFEIPKLYNEEIITIKDYDAGGPDFFLRYSKENNEHFDSHLIFYEFDKIEIEGENASLKSFCNEIGSDLPENTTKWAYSGIGQITLDSYTDLTPISNPPGTIQMESSPFTDQLKKQDFELIVFSCEHEGLNSHFISYLRGIRRSQFKEFLGIKSVTFYKSSKILLQLNYNQNLDYFIPLVNQDLFPAIANPEVIEFLDRVVYQKNDQPYSITK